MKYYIIFGTGKGGKRAIEMLNQFQDTSIVCCIDNFPKDCLFEGYKVFQAKDYLFEKYSEEHYVLIASVYRDEIYEQLIESKIDEEKIVSMLDVALEHIDEIYSQIDFCKCINGNRMKIVFDFANGFGLGGVESWSYNLADDFISGGYEVKLISGACDADAREEYVQFSTKTSVNDYLDFNINSIKKFICEIEKQLPCIVFAAHASDFLIASIILKKKYKDDIKIVSVIHGGLRHLAHDNRMIIDYVDYVFCVSPDMKKLVIGEDKKYECKVLFKETPIYISELNNRKYNLKKDEPIRIGYAARLEKLHKHSELIIDLINELEKLEINYILNIAGDGSLYKKISDFILENNLGYKINMYGEIRQSDMNEFWKQNDIAVNFSECEGCSLSMLESMAAGAVPIFTDVFSTRHFITDYENGFVVKFNDISDMADRIDGLYKNRPELRKMGLAAHKIIKEKCNKKIYYDYIRSNIIL